MTVQSRIDTLKQRHASLEAQIAAEDQRPKPDSAALAKLKIEKLRVKEEMSRLQTVD
jgi:hypothetical protein